MSLYGTMRTSASGMAAQSSRLGTVADNIANANTTGYKRASTEFSSMILESGLSQYTSGGVRTHVRHAISEQGTFSYTTSSTDLAIRGNGFFVVAGPSGQSFLTRAGSFVMDGEGRLVNAAGFTLMGYGIAGGAAPNVIANAAAGLEEVNIGRIALQATPSTAGSLFVNLPANADIIPASDLPSANDPASAYSGRTSLICYGHLGNEVMLDIYASKVAAGTWEVAVFDRAAAALSGGFPYASGPLTTTTMTFNPTTGQLDGASPTSVSIPVPGGETLTLDMSQSSQLAGDYMVRSPTVNGNGPSAVERFEFSSNGVLSAIFDNGSRVALYQVPLAGVVSPDNLQPVAGNVFLPSANSGDLQLGFPGSEGFGSIIASALEQSTVDIATELTTMIEAQRNYTVNSKVFQTGAELLEVLANLKR